MRFHIATDLGDALAAMADGARPIAGGTDLVVASRAGKGALPTHLVAIDRLAELRTIDVLGNGTMNVGALATHADLMTDPAIVGRATAIADASALVGSPATRHVGTLGGNIMNGSPAMDTGAPLVALGATVELRSRSATRTIDIDDLWTGPGRTVATSDELCTAVRLPAPRPRAGSAYVRLEYRRAMEIAVVGAAAAVELDEDDSLASLRVALSAAAPTIVAVPGLDSVVGSHADDDILAEVARCAASTARPIGDLRASERYRRHTVGVMARRAVAAAVARATGEQILVPVNRSIGIGAR